MPRIYKLTKIPLRLIYKIRHHRGHGIHSPFVFDLINKVIEEKTAYYRYDDIGVVLDAQNRKKIHLTKYNKLYFKLVNYFNAQNILEIGSGTGINTLCLTAPSDNIVCNAFEPSQNKRESAEQLYRAWSKEINRLTEDELLSFDKKQDCIFIDLKNCCTLNLDFEHFLPKLIDEHSFIIVNGIRANKHNRQKWKTMGDMLNRTVMLDLFNVGILFFNPKLYRWKYWISF